MFKKIQNQFLVTVLAFAFLFVFYFTQGVEAATLKAKFYTNTLEAKVGDEINLQLKINPEQDVPVYTVSADLFYNPNLLGYVGSGYSEDSQVFGVQKPPYFLEDTENGMIRLTAGYPQGATTLTGFTKYKFTAKSKGVAKIYIQGGKALNAENTDIGLQQKELTINIVDATSTGTSTDAVPPEVHNIDLSLDILGPIAIYKQEAYTFPIDKVGTVGDSDVKMRIFVYNQKTELFYKEEKTINKDNENEPLYFTIPANTLEIGNYVISVETLDENGNSKIIAQKNIGVLSNGETWYTRNKNWFLPVFIFFAIIAILHHIAKDRDLYFKIAEIRRGRVKIRTLRTIKKISKKNLKNL